jgi:hypothetical protein
MAPSSTEWLILGRTESRFWIIDIGHVIVHNHNYGSSRLLWQKGALDKATLDAQSTVG